MADPVKPRQCITTEQAEFLVPQQQVLEAFIAPEDRQRGDDWSFINDPTGLVIVRRRETQEPAPVSVDAPVAAPDHAVVVDAIVAGSELEPLVPPG